MRLGLICALALATACGPSGGSGGDDEPSIDDDGDGISNADEGGPDNDTDADGTPNFRDTDSDNDGIDDAIEAGDGDLATKPVDSDGDGTPDYLDLDSDNNMLPDKLEGALDNDGDTLADYADPDDDNDSIYDIDELGPDPLTPVNTDSDNDTILDAVEGNTDYDGDATGNFQDLDSDGDCVPDAMEARGNPPADSDGDGRMDFIDRDSDGDGLGDTDEDANCNGVRDGSETNATDDDTDGDGVTDLVEVAAGTNPNSSTSNPQANGDYVFVEPYMKPQMPPDDNLNFSSKLQAVDVYVLLDRSGSMSQEITAVRDNLNTVVQTLKCAPMGTGTPPNCIPDLWFGGATFAYRESGAEAFVNYADLGVNTNFSGIPINDPGCSQCLEVMTFAAYTAMTSVGSDAFGGLFDIPAPFVPAKTTCMNSPAANAGYSTFGYGCFRVGALPVVMLVTDEPPFSSHHNPLWSNVVPEYTRADRRARLMGVLGSNITIGTDTQLRQMATDTNAVDQNNQPLVFDGAGPNAATAIGNGVLTLANSLPLDLNAVVTDVTGDAVDAPAAFIHHIQTSQVSSSQCTMGLTDIDTDGDTFKDKYVHVRTGTPVCWKVVAKPNTTVQPTQEPQLFQARVTVYGDGITQLDQRRVFFLVPPAPLDLE
jgi:hypothetical protein